MSSGRRITLALVGLVLLAVIGYLVTARTDHGTQGAHRPATTVTRTVPVSPPAPTRAGASG